MHLPTKHRRHLEAIVRQRRARQSLVMRAHHSHTEPTKRSPQRQTKAASLRASRATRFGASCTRCGSSPTPRGSSQAQRSLVCSATMRTGGSTKAVLGAWTRLVPRQHSTGGHDRVLGISERGIVYLRNLLVHCARSVLRARSSARSTTPAAGLRRCRIYDRNISLHPNSNLLSHRREDHKCLDSASGAL